MKEIEDLFNGRIRPFENLSLNRRYFDLHRELDEDLFKIKEKLSEEDKRLVDKADNQYRLIEEEILSQVFKNGFSLGVKLTAEGFLNNGNKTK